MRLTIINQYYIPDISPTAHLAASLAEHRAAQGDQVTVITSRGSYVKLKRTDKKLESSNNPRVLLVWTPRFSKRRKFLRMLDYGAFYVGSLLRVITLARQDVIVSLTTPPFIAIVGVIHKLLHSQTKLVVWNMDCYPEIIERTGLIREYGWIATAMRAINRWVFEKLDYLVTLDQAMQDLLLSQYSPRAKRLAATTIPNWERFSLFREPGLPVHKEQDSPSLNRHFTILYLGNTGFGHCFEAVRQAAIDLRNERVLFLFIGGGARWQELETAVKQHDLTNIKLKGYVSKEDTPAIMRSVDCALITMQDFALGVMSPSKLHSNLAMGLPILYVGPKGSNVDEAISTYRCGVSVRNNRPDQLVASIRKLMSSPADREVFSKRARHAFEDAYCETQTLPKFDLVFDSLRGKAGTASDHATNPGNNSPRDPTS